MATPSLQISSTVLGAPDPRSLAEFYRELLGWEIRESEPDWVILKPPGGPTGLAFQLEENHNPPAWPAGPGDQQMQVHLDIAVHGELNAGVARATSLGAIEAEHQPQPDVRVMLDPAGHPFCLFAAG